MGVRLVFHGAVRESLREWLRTIERGPGGSPGLAMTYLETLEAELIRTRGRPTGSAITNWLEPPMGVWEFQFRRWWIVYVLRSRGGFIGRMLGRSDLEIVLLQIHDHPPSEAQLASLANQLSPRA